MARKQVYSPPPSADLSIEQMKSALPRLEKRLADLRAFNPAKVTERDDPAITALENAIDDFLVKTFGRETAEYGRYSSATNLDTAGLSIGRPTPTHEVIQGLEKGKGRAIAILGGIRSTFLEEIALVEPETVRQPTQGAQSNPDSREIFVVHGSDHGTRDAVARFLDKLGLVPVILDEEANRGRTIHQKFRDHSTVAYAVVLFTPDDEGKRAGSSDILRPRPRQNVVYELGFFSAKIGDGKVCVLLSEGVEMPSDLNGVIYITHDQENAWKFKLAKEIKAAGLEVDMNKV